MAWEKNECLNSENLVERTIDVIKIRSAKILILIRKEDSLSMVLVFLAEIAIVDLEHQRKFKS
jgi:hypothetical protein